VVSPGRGVGECCLKDYEGRYRLKPVGQRVQKVGTKTEGRGSEESGLEEEEEIKCVVGDR